MRIAVVYQWTNVTEANQSYGCNISGAGEGGRGYFGLECIPSQNPYFGNVGIKPRREAEVVAPSDMVAVGDYPGMPGGQDSDLFPWRFASGEVNEKMMTEEDADHLAARHNKGANVLFCDAHVEFAKVRKWNEATDEARCRWDHDHKPHREIWQDVW